MTQAVNYFAWQRRLIVPELGRRVVEVGCGLGNFTRMLLDRDLIVALDVEPGCIEHLLHRFPNQPNLHALVCEPGGPEFAALARFQPDSCVCLNVLEHIEDDWRALRAMASILPSSGVIVLFVPAFPALYGPIDRNLEHHRRYTRRALRELAVSLGLHIRKLRYVNLVGFFGWWLNAHVFRREAQSETQIAVFDRAVVPLMSRVESLVPPPFGQSLLAVLSKP